MKPVYFINQAWRGAEERYIQMEKLAFALTIASRKLRPYFQAHTVKVLTEYPLKKVPLKLDLSDQLINWAIKLIEFDIEFMSRSAIKGQALVDFLVEFTNIPGKDDAPRDALWIIYVDGSSTKRNGCARVVLMALSGERMCNSLRLEFKTTNNEAEYEAVLAGLRLAQEMGVECV